MGIREQSLEPEGRESWSFPTLAHSSQSGLCREDVLAQEPELGPGLASKVCALPTTGRAEPGLLKAEQVLVLQVEETKMYH